MSKKLTMREREIMCQRARGLALKEIADNLRISVSTVKTHLDRVYKKRGVHSGLELQWSLRTEASRTPLQSLASRLEALSVKVALYNEKLQAWHINPK